MAQSRRRPHPTKLIAAVVLMTLATVVGTAALLLSTVEALSAATVVGVLCGAAACAFMFAEVIVMRRTWAFDRAQQAHGYRLETRKRHAAHMQFVGEVTNRMDEQEDEIRLVRLHMALLQDAVLSSEIETALAQERLSAEKARSAALKADADAAASDLASARADLLKAQDALAASEAAGVAARAEMLAIEESVEASGTRTAPGRRRLTA